MALTAKQENILNFIRDFGQAHGYPPSIREIGQNIGISSTSVVNYNLLKLEREGHLERNPTISRGIRLAGPSAARSEPSERFRVPMVGTIVASKPMPVPDDSFADIPQDMVELTRDIVRPQEGLFALRVKGDSMIDALVNDGDIVVMKKPSDVHNGDMVGVRLKDRNETTLKRIYRERGRVRLQPANPRMKPIYVSAANIEVQGKVVAVIRQMAA
ncbi:MAG: transcriptional repressor LexA [Chloroflexi bacterium]|nr:transcriptional repressor LexA [Chloroflexota bacterium]